MFEHLTLFGTYGAVRNLLLSRSEDKERNLTMGELLLAGAFSGLGTGVILTRALASSCYVRARARVIGVAPSSGTASPAPRSQLTHWFLLCLG